MSIARIASTLAIITRTHICATALWVLKASNTKMIQIIIILENPFYYCHCYGDSIPIYGTSRTAVPVVVTAFVKCTRDPRCGVSDPVERRELVEIKIQLIDVVAVIQRNLQLRSRERNEFLEFLELEGTGTLLRFQGKLSQLLAEEELMLAKAGSHSFLDVGRSLKD
ncbi:hypothetical protein HPP92_017352 [Vanilla planifolia]|uniref:Uncharacterized protein n=1 Tax=Vanilla planifolia TaxID=51239 RepID=A0A835QMZ5_VANPL|nr:hypothetical protein HPP92_017352 [Vanilla planifolia]